MAQELLVLIICIFFLCSPPPSPLLSLHQAAEESTWQSSKGVADELYTNNTHIFKKEKRSGAGGERQRETPVLLLNVGSNAVKLLF